MRRPALAGLLILAAGCGRLDATAGGAEMSLRPIPYCETDAECALATGVDLDGTVLDSLLTLEHDR